MVLEIIDNSGYVSVSGNTFYCNGQVTWSRSLCWYYIDSLVMMGFSCCCASYRNCLVRCRREWERRFRLTWLRTRWQLWSIDQFWILQRWWWWWWIWLNISNYHFFFHKSWIHCVRWLEYQWSNSLTNSKTRLIINLRDNWNYKRNKKIP